jgi:hypothetical protein
MTDQPERNKRNALAFYEYTFQITSSPCRRQAFSSTLNRGALNCLTA